jgi:hypothetical protein
MFFSPLCAPYLEAFTIKEAIFKPRLASQVMTSKCWLCLNNTDPTSQKLHSFMLQNISSIGVDAMTDMMHTHLQKIAPDCEGTSKMEIKEHIQKGHLLSPSLQISHILRSLLDLRDTLHSMLISEDENGIKTVDARNMSVYLKVIAEIMQVYRMGDMSKMLFATEERGGGGK